MRRAARVDDNQGVIVDALRCAGVSVLITSHIGEGFPDLMCHSHRKGIVLMELKMPKRRGRLSDAQKKLMREFPVMVVTTPVEALAAMGCEVE